MSDELVRIGYEAAAARYAGQRDQFRSIPYLEAFAAQLGPGASILDVGCGAGKPVDAFLVDRGFAVHGIDISRNMIELARGNVPQATYEVRDMSELTDRAYQVDGIVAFYSIFHTPREQHQDQLARFASFLPPGGMLLITMGAGEWKGTEDDFHGVRMFWSHFGAERNLAMVQDAGFEIVFDEIDTSSNEEHQVIIARLG